MNDNRSGTAQTVCEGPAHTEGSEVFDLFIAELVSRRERLQQLLRMVTIEANRHARTSATGRSRSACKGPASRRA